MDQPLKNRIAVVTGASSGIGEATAKHLAALGASVALIARRTERLDAIAKELSDRGTRVLTAAIDVRDRAAVLATADTIATELGRVDLVVNNAGLMLAANVAEKAHDDWQAMIDINIKGLLAITEAFVAPLVEAAASGPADLVNISSIGASGIFPHFGVYCASKAFVTHLSKNLRADLGPKRVRVSVVEPGLTATELQGHVTDAASNAWLEGARGQLTWLEADDIARTIGFIASQPRHVSFQQVTVLPTQQS